VNAETDARPGADAGATRTYGFTFGHFQQKEDWTDVRLLTWPELVPLLTTHAVGRKEGACIVPAVFSGTRRKKAEAVRIDVAFLDSDGGATLEEIRTAVAARGWAAIVASTHSHLTTRTTVKRSEWERFRRERGDAAGAERFLLEVKGYLPRVAAGARHAGEVGDHVLLEHAPCPKFRIAIPLLRPWRAADHRDWREGAEVWKGRVEALAAALGLHHDQACTDTSRLFFLPRRPADGPPPEAAVLDGAECDVFALPDPPGDGGLGFDTGRKKYSRRTRHGRDDDAGDHVDPDTGEVLDLTAWARRHGARFLVVKALRARCPAAFTGHVAEGTRHHIRCPNEAEHTGPGPDGATFVADAGASTGAKGFVVHCLHAHCDGRDRLFFVRRMLEQRWLTPADLTDPDFLAGNNAPPRPFIRFMASDMPQIVDQAEDALLKAASASTSAGPSSSARAG
jgi:hypothetical protein